MSWVTLSIMTSGKKRFIWLLQYLLVFYFLYFDLNQSGKLDFFLFDMMILLCSLVAMGLFFNVTRRYYYYQEYQTDTFALQATGKIQVFKHAMTRLTNENLFVAKSKSPRRIRRPAIHPTLVERLQHADEFASRDSNSVQM